jgi:hypothetical protein
LIVKRKTKAKTGFTHAREGQGTKTKAETGSPLKTRGEDRGKGKGKSWIPDKDIQE